MGFSVAEATKACRMRRSRGEGCLWLRVLRLPEDRFLTLAGLVLPDELEVL